MSGQRRSQRKRNRESEKQEKEEQEEYVVEALLRIRDNDQGEKQVRVKWEGYRRETWERYKSIKERLPEMMAELEQELVIATDDDKSVLTTFLAQFIAQHEVNRTYRWRPDRLNTLEQAAASHSPPIRVTAEELRRRMMRVINSV
jgi:hypothetical protein